MLFVCLEVLWAVGQTIMAERRMERAAPGRNETGFCFPVARLHGALSTVLAGLWWASRQTNEASWSLGAWPSPMSRQTNSPIYSFFVS